MPIQRGKPWKVQGLRIRNMPEIRGPSLSCLSRGTECLVYYEGHPQMMWDYWDTRQNKHYVLSASLLRNSIRVQSGSAASLSFLGRLSSFQVTFADGRIPGIVPPGTVKPRSAL
ncbi:unnamed protein product [Pleuronectes platessa]|uniref:Uncharacterized protein n=1 Tax=Pleuronectes platessa TaxID=8262 RepID=A0A9N7U2Q0_PLEPL|nr:unnamed protein product [Pleuronectes platessa]